MCGRITDQEHDDMNACTNSTLYMLQALRNACWHLRTLPPTKVPGVCLN